MVTVFLMLFISTSIFYLTPIYEQQVSYKNLELVRDKEEYQKASDKGKKLLLSNILILLILKIHQKKLKLL